jgi:hypothetical protein
VPPRGLIHAPMRVLMTVFALHLLCAPTLAQRGIIVDYAKLPAANETELFNRAVLAVRGRVEARTLHAPPPNEGPTSTFYSVRILELLKSAGQLAVGQVVDVHRHGGFNDKDTMDLAFPEFQVDEELVLFLERGRNGWFWPLNGPDGAFKLTTDGRVYAYGRSGAVSKRHAGRPVDEFMAILRTHKN